MRGRVDTALVEQIDESLHVDPDTGVVTVAGTVAFAPEREFEFASSYLDVETHAVPRRNERFAVDLVVVRRREAVLRLGYPRPEAAVEFGVPITVERGIHEAWAGWLTGWAARNQLRAVSVPLSLGGAATLAASRWGVVIAVLDPHSGLTATLLVVAASVLDPAALPADPVALADFFEARLRDDAFRLGRGIDARRSTLDEVNAAISSASSSAGPLSWDASRRALNVGTRLAIHRQVQPEDFPAGLVRREIPTSVRLDGVVDGWSVSARFLRTEGRLRCDWVALQLLVDCSVGVPLTVAGDQRLQAFQAALVQPMLSAAEAGGVSLYPRIDPVSGSGAQIFVEFAPEQ